MKMKTLELLRNLQHRLSSSRRWLFVTVIALCLVPSSTRAQGIGDLLLLLHTITSTLQGPIGDALNEMRKVSTEINNFRQKIIWPLALINQTRSFVSATRAHYTGLMSQIEGLKNNSATLALPMQLESMFRGAQSGSLGQIPSLYTQVYQPVALAGIAQPGSATSWTLTMRWPWTRLRLPWSPTNDSGDANSRRFSRTAGGDCGSWVGVHGHCPGRVADLVTQAQFAKMLAAQLRQEATKLAHQNATLKHSATTTQNLFNQIQQVLAHP